MNARVRTTRAGVLAECARVLRPAARCTSQAPYNGAATSGDRLARWLAGRENELAECFDELQLGYKLHASPPSAASARPSRFRRSSCDAEAVLPRLQVEPRSLLNPPIVVGSLVVVQWAALAAFVLVVRHNGWLFYQGGDQTFFYTASWVLSAGHVPEAQIGYAWPYLLSPIALAAGPSFLAALPAIVLFQVAVLVPLALYCVYAVAARIGGRAIGYVAAVLWIAVPFAAIPLWDDRYHAKYVEQLLPQAFGLTGLGDFPSMVCLLVAALFCLRALDEADPLDGALAGLAAGFAIGIKPANALFLAGPLLAFVVGRRVREGLAFGVALLPSLLALVLWKYRGLGYLPIVTPPSEAFALAGPAGGSPARPLSSAVDRYLELDWSRLGENYVELRDLFWGVPLLQSLPLLGLLAAVRRSWPKALLLAGWLAAFVLVKGSSNEASVESGTLLRLLIPAFPPLLVLVALLPLLVPPLARRLRQRVPPSAAPIRRPSVALAGVVFALVPVVLVAALPPLEAAKAAKLPAQSVHIPIVDTFELRARVSSSVVRLAWSERETGSAASFYTVYRSRARFLLPKGGAGEFPTVSEGLLCDRPSGGAVRCSIEMLQIATTRTPAWAETPPPGRWTYRVGVAANWLDDETFGDTLLISRPVTVLIR